MANVKNIEDFDAITTIPDNSVIYLVNLDGVTPAEIDRKLTGLNLKALTKAEVLATPGVVGNIVKFAAGGGSLEDAGQPAQDQDLRTTGNPSWFNVNMQSILARLMWTFRSAPDFNGATNTVAAVAASDDTILAAITDGTIWSSTDKGYTWTQVASLGGANAFRCLAYGGGLWVGGTNAGGTMWSSPDGTNWTSQQTLDAGSSVSQVVYGYVGSTPTWCAGLNGGAPTYTIWTSADGAAWTGQNNPGNVVALHFGHFLGTSQYWIVANDINDTYRQMDPAAAWVFDSNLGNPIVDSSAHMNGGYVVFVLAVQNGANTEIWRAAGNGGGWALVQTITGASSGLTFAQIGGMLLAIDRANGIIWGSSDAGYWSFVQNIGTLVWPPFRSCTLGFDPVGPSRGTDVLFIARLAVWGPGMSDTILNQ